MATKKKSEGKKRAPFLARFVSRVTKLSEWAEKTQSRFATAPNSNVSDSLGAINDSLEEILESGVPGLKSWSPPTRSPAFAVGDDVTFKKDKLDEMVKAGLYAKDDLSGAHKVLAVAGRKVKLDAGVFSMTLVSKNAA